MDQCVYIHTFTFRSKTMEEAEKPTPPACENPGSDAQIQETGHTPDETGSDVTKKKVSNTAQH